MRDAQVGWIRGRCSQPGGAGRGTKEGGRSGRGVATSGHLPAVRKRHCAGRFGPGHEGVKGPALAGRSSASMHCQGAGAGEGKRKDSSFLRSASCVRCPMLPLRKRSGWSAAVPFRASVVFPSAPLVCPIERDNGSRCGRTGLDDEKRRPRCSFRAESPSAWDSQCGCLSPDQHASRSSSFLFPDPPILLVDLTSA